MLENERSRNDMERCFDLLIKIKYNLMIAFTQLDIQNEYYMFFKRNKYHL